jgi:hypothetical protein
MVNLSLKEPTYNVSVRFNRYLELVPPAVTVAGERAVTFLFSPRAAVAAGTATLTPSTGEAIPLPACR